jgi:ferredoxin-NADP reductase
MAVPKHATVIRSDALSPSTRHVVLQAEAPLGFVGGQYVIVDSGLTLPNGKAAKRAYSLLSADEEQERLEFAVMRIEGGPCSGYMHGLQAGDRVAFSGPWGKLVLPDAPVSGPVLILATDTGITAALGLLRSRRMQPLLASAELVWLHPQGDDFLPHDFVRERLPAECERARIETLPAVADPQRVPHVRALLGSILERRLPSRVFVSGDGAVNYALLDDLATAGIPCTRDNVESFFNMPKKSAPVSSAAPSLAGDA